MGRRRSPKARLRGGKRRPSARALWGLWALNKGPSFRFSDSPRAAAQKMIRAPGSQGRPPSLAALRCTSRECESRSAGLDRVDNANAGEVHLYLRLWLCDRLSVAAWAQVEISHLQAGAPFLLAKKRALHGSQPQAQVLQGDEIHQLVQYLDHEGLRMASLKSGDRGC